MALDKDVASAVEGLLELGVLNEEGLLKLKGLFDGLRAFSGSFGGGKAAKASEEDESGYYAKEELPEDKDDVPYVPRASFHHEGKPQNGDEYSQDDGSDGFEPQAPPAAVSTGYKTRKRAPKGSFNPTKVELQDLRESGMTVKQIAELRGVSAATVNNKLREYGLTDSSRGRPRK